jgi:hypothetical protein
MGDRGINDVPLVATDRFSGCSAQYIAVPSCGTAAEIDLPGAMIVAP